LLNAIIDGLNLKELQMSGKKYIWANNLATPTFEKLDRILMTTKWEEKFPLSMVQALTREMSDHTPLLLNSGEPSQVATQPMFKFELGWLLRDGFKEMVRDIWTNTIVGRTPMERWKGKIHRLRKHLRGWEKHKWPLKREKEILNTLDSLDKKAENILLQLDELNLKQCLNNRLAHMLHEEEIKWYQRTKVKELLEGDSNTRGRPRTKELLHLILERFIWPADTQLILIRQVKGR
jgi:hypothetical protein